LLLARLSSPLNNDGGLLFAIFIPALPPERLLDRPAAPDYGSFCRLI
jgi:hypothetical protein